MSSTHIAFFFNCALEGFELGLNMIGYLSPGLAGVRCCYGFVQMITACAINIIAGVGAFISQAIGNEEAHKRFTFVEDLSSRYMEHGALNIVRSLFERLFGLFMILYDLSRERYSYQQLTAKVRQFQPTY